MSVFQRMFSWAKVWSASSKEERDLAIATKRRRTKEKKQAEEEEEMEEKARECPLCLALVTPQEAVRMSDASSCDHWCCEGCLARFLADRHARADRHPLTCFAPECASVLTRRVVARVLGAEQLERWEKLHVRSALQGAGENSLHCPKRGCEALLVLPSAAACRAAAGGGDWFRQGNACGDCGSSFELKAWMAWVPGRWWATYECDLCGMMFCYRCVAPAPLDVPLLGYKQPHKMCWKCSEGVLSAECPDCTHEFCLRCLRGAHPKALCADLKLRAGFWFSAPRSGPNEQQRSRDLMVDRGFRPCAGCGIVVEKNQGCNHITHRGCAQPTHDGNITHFCYVCGDAYGPNMGHNCRGTQHLTRSIGHPVRKPSLREFCEGMPKQVKNRFLAFPPVLQWALIILLVLVWAGVVYTSYQFTFGEWSA